MSSVIVLSEAAMEQQEGQDEAPSEAQIAIDGFWPKVTDEVKKIKSIEPGNQILPLARIKKIMKLDEDVKMISAEAPLLFAKACEVFIHELTLRSWLHTDDNKRRTLQRNDIAMAISKYDQFDFLIDIVPRDEIKPKKEEPPKPSTSAVAAPEPQTQAPFQVCYATNVGEVQATQQQQPQQTQIPQQATVQTLAGNQLIGTPMIIPIQTTQGGISIPQLGQLVAQPQQIQQIANVLLPSGEVAQIPVPISQQHLNFIRAQMQLGAQNPSTPQQGQTTATPQPIILQQAPQQLNLHMNQIFALQNQQQQAGGPPQTITIHGPPQQTQQPSTSTSN